jgi:hypothetical protein
MTSSEWNSVPKSPNPNTVTLGIKNRYMNFVGDTSQSTAGSAASKVWLESRSTVEKYSVSSAPLLQGQEVILGVRGQLQVCRTLHS